MFKVVDAYLYKPNTVVLHKKDITNAKDEEFEPVRLIIRARDIREWNEEIKMLGLEGDGENDIR